MAGNWLVAESMRRCKRTPAATDVGQSEGILPLLKSAMIAPANRPSRTSACRIAAASLASAQWARKFTRKTTQRANAWRDIGPETPQTPGFLRSRFLLAEHAKARRTPADAAITIANDAISNSVRMSFEITITNVRKLYATNCETAKIW